MNDWTEETGTNAELETYNFMSPRRKGNFEYKEVENFAGQAKVLSVRARLPAAGKEYLPMYSVLAHRQGVPIPGQPTEIGLMVNGNGGWGRVIWEVEDAKGQRWVSLGAEQAGEPSPWLLDWLGKDEFAKMKSASLSDWNSNDAWGRSYINFEGWRYLSFPLPGNYPGEGYHWPYSSQWRCQAKDGTPGDGIVHYPLKFTKLALTLPEKVLYGTQYEPPRRAEIYLRDLAVTYRKPEEAFTSE